MKVINVKEANPYNPPNHHGMVALKLSDKAHTGLEKFWVGMSHFLPGGGAQWDYEQSPTEKVYVVLEGELTIKTKDEERTLTKGDAVYLAPNEGREIVNKTNFPTSILVIVTNN